MKFPPLAKIIPPNIGIAAAILSAYLPAAALAQSATPQKGGTLIFATDREPSCLDPNVVGDMPQLYLARQFLDSLVAIDSNGNIKPWLAESWSISPDGKTYTFHLRHGVTFSNGEKFDSHAVKANLDHIVDPKTGAMSAIFIREYASTDTPDPYTAVIHLSEANSSFLDVLAEGVLGLEAPSTIGLGNAANCARPIGTGPFEIVSWLHSNEVILKRNPNYNWAPSIYNHQGPAYLDTIIWKFIQEPSVRFASLLGGQVDVIDHLPPESQASQANNPDLTFLQVDRGGNPTNGTFNTTRPPFNDIRVREAFVKSADIDAALKSIFFGEFHRAQGPLSSVTPFFTADFANLDSYDPAAANKLLDEAGWTGRDANGIRTKNGKPLIVHLLLDSSLTTEDRALWEQVQATARTVGFDVHLDNVSDIQQLQLYANWDYDIYPGYWNGDNADILRLEFGSASRGANGSQFHGNGSGFANTQFDQIVLQAAQSLDPNQQRQLYHQAQGIIASQYLQLRTYPQNTRLGVYKTVHGVHFEPSMNLAVFYDAWVTK